MASERGGEWKGLRAAGTAGTAAIALGLLSTLWRAPPLLLLWNASASSPIGLYRIEPAGRLHRGDMVIAWPPDVARDLASRRRYLPRNVPLVKPVAAIAGDRVCARAAAVFVNGRFAAERRAADPSGRPMPRWTGCAILGAGDLLLLSANAPRAFDGRYFGITRERQLLGKAKLLWRV